MSELPHRKAFEQFAEQAQKELGDSLDKLFLYGSVACDQQTEQSDVDILAVVEVTDQKEKLRDIAFEIGIQYGISFSPIVKTEKEYEEMKNTVYGREVRSTGELYV
ncbi:nucleotidyltransferase domain-containing protein [Candidatus Nanohalobium constans]|uniref:Nucleotidyltransferase domain-containing protein n=1 Tax=Candidatus Nanohalobium constans TaxID=2565781 RepID=A0A5Q0UHF6_9ARCH|nr:nucleotidyltransferase domain-containing protein [Candidatus Nanohalobium constans]QGA81067.1 nucleotidyltransferase domain-containing protein [Candidatus Nanohalobium constans]